MNIYVGNLTDNVSEEDLKKAFLAFGKVDSVSIIKDKYTNETKGFGFIEMPSSAEGKAAMDGLNGQELKGKNLIVNEARERTERRGGSRGGKSGGRRF